MIGDVVDALLLAQTIDLDPTRGPNPMQTALAVGFAAFVSVVGALFLRYVGQQILDEQERKHSTEIESGLRNRDWKEIRLSAEDSLRDRLGAIRDLFVGDFESDVPSIPQALAEVRNQWKSRRQAATGAVRDEVPGLSRLLSATALAYLVLGAIVLESLATWSALVQTESTAKPITLSVVLDVFVDAVRTVIDVLGAFPFAGAIYKLTFMAAMIGGEFLYSHVYVVSAILFVGSIAIWIGDRRVADELEPRLYVTRPRAVLGAFAIIVSMWMAGVLVVLPFRSVGAVTIAGTSIPVDTIGSVLALLASLGVGFSLAAVQVRNAARRLSTTYRQAEGGRSGKLGTFLYVAARKLFAAVWIAALLVLPIYAAKAISTGKAMAVATTLLSESDLQIRAVVVFVSVLTFFFLVVQTRPAWGDLSAAIRRSLDRRGLKIALATRGFPYLIVILAVPLLAATPFMGWPRAIAGAVAIGIAVRLLLELKTRAELAHYRHDISRRKPGRVFVEGVLVEDANGREIAVADVNGNRIAAPVDPIGTSDDLPTGGVDELAEQVVTDAEAIFESFTPAPSVYAFYYERALEGETDFERVRTEYLGDISRTIESRLERTDDGRLNRSELDDFMTNRFDEQLYRKKLYEKRAKSNPDVVIYDGVVRLAQ